MILTSGFVRGGLGVCVSSSSPWQHEQLGMTQNLWHSYNIGVAHHLRMCKHAIKGDVILNRYSICTNNRFIRLFLSMLMARATSFTVLFETRGHFAVSDKDQSNRFFFLLPQFPYKASPKMADDAPRAKLAIQMFEPSRSAG